MRYPTALAIVVLILTQSPGLVSAQEGGNLDDSLAQKGTAWLRIVTDIDSAIVMLGGVVVGKTPFVAESLSAGRYEVKILHPDLANWVTPTVSDTIRLVGGENTTLKYTLVGGIVVQSIPDGAMVAIRDSLLGVTPLTLLPGRLPRGEMIQVKKAGFEPVLVDLSLAKRGVLAVPLRRQAGSVAEGVDGGLIISNGQEGRTARLYISAGVLLVSGIATVWFKNTADQRQEAYSITGDPYLLAESRRLDTAAAISLGVLQVNIGLFLYFLLSD
jgi:hypothetical protein